LQLLSRYRFFSVLLEGAFLELPVGSRGRGLNHVLRVNIDTPSQARRCFDLI